MLKDVYTKLKVKDGMGLLVLNAPDEYLSLSEEIPLSITVETEGKGHYPFVQLFAKNQQELRVWGETAIHALEDDGLLWICYPKKSSKLFEDLSRDEGWDAVTSLGKEGVSLISIDDTWSAMRFRPQNAASKEKKRPVRSAKQEEETTKEAVMPFDLKERLKQEPEAEAFFAGLAASYKKEYLEWLTGAKREETKIKRINEMVEKLKQGFKNPYAR